MSAVFEDVEVNGGVISVGSLPAHNTMHLRVRELDRIYRFLAAGKKRTGTEAA